MTRPGLRLRRLARSNEATCGEFSSSPRDRALTRQWPRWPRSRRSTATAALDPKRRDGPRRAAPGLSRRARTWSVDGASRQSPRARARGSAHHSSSAAAPRIRRLSALDLLARLRSPTARGVPIGAAGRSRSPPPAFRVRALDRFATAASAIVGGCPRRRASPLRPRRGLHHQRKRSGLSSDARAMAPDRSRSLEELTSATSLRRRADGARRGSPARRARAFAPRPGLHRAPDGRASTARASPADAGGGVASHPARLGRPRMKRRHFRVKPGFAIATSALAHGAATDAASRAGRSRRPATTPAFERAICPPLVASFFTRAQAIALRPGGDDPVDSPARSFQAARSRSPHLRPSVRRDPVSSSPCS